MFSERNYTWSNWARNYDCKADVYYEPENELEICEIAAAANREGKRIRVVGSGHSFSPIALSNDILVSLKKLNKITSVDRDSVTCQPGAVLSDIYAALQTAGLSLGNFGVINKQTLAGAISTGTHGSGLTHKSLSGKIRKLRMVLADGSVREIDADTSLRIGDTEYNLLDAASVSLGLLGIVTSITLSCEPLFYLSSREEVMSFDEYLGNMDELARKYEYFKAWWFPHTGKVYVFKTERITREEYNNGKELEDYAPWQKERDRVLDETTSPLFIKSHEAHESIPEINRHCLDYFFTPRRRIGTSFEILVHEETVPMIVSEYAFPLESDTHRKALTQFRDALESSSLTLHFPVDLRYGAGESSWLSSAHERPSFYIGICVREYYGKEIPDSMNLFFRIMKELGGRPNWGKLFDQSPSELQKVYPRLRDFTRVKKALDPGTVFTNKHLDAWFGDQIS